MARHITLVLKLLLAHALFGVCVAVLLWLIYFGLGLKWTADSVSAQLAVFFAPIVETASALALLPMGLLVRRKRKRLGWAIALGGPPSLAIFPALPLWLEICLIIAAGLYLLALITGRILDWLQI